MKRLDTPSSRSKRAAIYRAAAQHAEGPNSYGSSCHEIERTIFPNGGMGGGYCEEVHHFGDTFSPEPNRDFRRAFWLEMDNRNDAENWRVLALCFMAAMVEAGDA